MRARERARSRHAERVGVLVGDIREGAARRTGVVMGLQHIAARRERNVLLRPVGVGLRVRVDVVVDDRGGCGTLRRIDVRVDRVDQAEGEDLILLDVMVLDDENVDAYLGLAGRNRGNPGQNRTNVCPVAVLRGRLKHPGHLRIATGRAVERNDEGNGLRAVGAFDDHRPLRGQSKPAINGH